MSVASPAVTRLAWRHPEWWVLALAAGAWVVVIRNAGHHAHAHGAGAALAGWMLMTVAMMLPLVAEHVRLTAERSLWRRRQRAMAGFVLGYLAVWALAGVAVSLVPLHPDSRTAAVALAIAGVWQLTPWKRRGLVGCHRTMPLAPRGWRADADCVRFGWRVGLRCALSCWALMLACAMMGHSLIAMVGVTGVMWAERHTRPRRRLFSAVLLGAAVVIGSAGVLAG